MVRGRKKKWVLFSAVYFVAACLIIAFVFYTFLTGDPVEQPGVSMQDAPRSDRTDTGAGAGDEAVLRVMTLNISHGSRTGPNPLFQDSASIRSNLDAVAAVLEREKPALAALQEADGPSNWSGGFDHVEFLAGKAGFKCSTRGEHVKGMGLSYGTALLSTLPLEDTLSVTFEPSPPTFTKGFVAAAVPWPGRPETAVDVVSVHLDFSRKSVRLRQAEEFIESMSPRGRPLIVLGDFNCEWADEESAVAAIAEGLGLAAYDPVASGLDTYSLLGKRLDWILISPEFEFTRYRVLPDEVSDHFGVIAEIRMRDAPR
jgi:endonuclease/exonuclease/phosphatase family metal-dependent hydrolase